MRSVHIDLGTDVRGQAGLPAARMPCVACNAVHGDPSGSIFMAFDANLGLAGVFERIAQVVRERTGASH